VGTGIAVRRKKLKELTLRTEWGRLTEQVQDVLLKKVQSLHLGRMRCYVPPAGKVKSRLREEVTPTLFLSSFDKVRSEKEAVREVSACCPQLLHRDGRRRGLAAGKEKKIWSAKTMLGESGS